MKKEFIDEKVILHYKAHKYGGATPAKIYFGRLIDIADGVAYLRDKDTERIFMFPLFMVLHIELASTLEGV